MAGIARSNTRKILRKNEWTGLAEASPVCYCSYMTEMMIHMTCCNTRYATVRDTVDHVCETEEFTETAKLVEIVEETNFQYNSLSPNSSKKNRMQRAAERDAALNAFGQKISNWGPEKIKRFQHWNELRKLKEAAAEWAKREEVLGQ